MLTASLPGCGWSGLRGCATHDARIQPEAPTWGVHALTCTSDLADAQVTWTVDGVPYEGGETVPAADTVLGREWACTATAGEQTATARVRPQPAGHNVILIVADDIGTGDIGVYGEGNEAPPTPHIDELAARGVLFRSAYAAPSCSPTRAAYLTGRQASRTGIGQIVHPWTDEFQLRPEEITIPEMLATSDRRWDSSVAGKWHLGSQRAGRPEEDPARQGFGWYAGSIGNLREPVVGFPLEDKAGWGYESWPKVQPDGSVVITTTYATTDTVDDAIARMGAMSEPWFLLVSLNAPHAPDHVPPASLHSRSELDEQSAPTDKFAATVEAMDHELGRLLDEVDPTDTTVVFYGDNGTPHFGVDADEDEDKQFKGSMREGGIHVPLIVTGPLVADPGSESVGLVHAVDLFTTVAVNAGVSVAELGRPIDGVSLLPYLATPSLTSIRDHLVVEKFRPNGAGPHRMKMRVVRDERYKLVVRHLPTGKRHVELYDLHGRSDDGPDLLGPRGTVSDPALRPVLARLKAEYQRVDSELGFDPGLPAALPR